MYFKEDAYMMRRIFQLSNRSLIRMVNHLFRTEYDDEEHVWKEWQEQEGMSVLLKIGGMNRYEFRLRRMDGWIQICAEDRGCVFYYENTAVDSVIQIREPRILYFGKGKEKEYSATLEFPGNERVMLPIRIVTLENYSAEQLEESGLILFLPFLFCCVVHKAKEDEEKREVLKEFLVRGIGCALDRSYRKGDLTAFDMQKLRQLCGQMAWNLRSLETWMQDTDIQELILNMMEADLDFLERSLRLEQNRNHKE